MLFDVDLEVEQRRCLAKACVQLQQGAYALCDEYLERNKRQIYVSPTSYLELLKVYKILLEEQRGKTSKIRTGYIRGVQKLISTRQQVLKMQQEVNEKQPKLEEMTEEADLLMQQIKQESAEVVEPKQAQI